MTRILPLCAALLLTWSGFAQDFWELMKHPSMKFDVIQKKAEKYFDKNGTGKGTGYKQYKRWEYEQLISLGEDGRIFNPVDAKEAWDKSHNQKDQVAQKSTAIWEELGPRSNNPSASTWRIGIGRVKGVAVDPNNVQRIFVTSPGGGVWRSEDGGSTWTPLTDDLPYLQAYSVAIDPNNSDKVFVGAVGFFLFSNDGGDTWQEADLGGDFTRADRIIVHPFDQNIVYFASSAGVYMSYNGGASFVRKAAINVEDIEFYPLNPGVMYASGNQVYRSNDSGNSWQQVGGISTVGRSKIAVSPADPESVWVLQAKGAEFGYVYKSTDRGVNFSVLFEGNRSQGTNYFGSSLSGASVGGQAWHNMGIAVSPTNPNEIHIGGINSWRSLDGGNSWEATSYWVYPNTVGYNHADMMTMEYVGNDLYVGTDGGIFKTINQGNDWIDLSQGLGIRMFYRIGITEQNPERVSGGSMDNGTSIRQGAGTSNWLDWLGADGMETFIDYTNQDVIYGAIQYGQSLYRTTDGGQTRALISSPGGQGEWVAPFMMDPQNANTIYVAKKEVYKSTDRGDTWQELFNPGHGSNIRLMHIASADNSYMYFANGESQMYGSNNAGQTWFRLNNPYAREFAIDPSNQHHLILFSYTDVWESIDGGINWTPYNKLLPEGETVMSVRWGEGSDSPLYIGTMTGVYYTDNTLSGWVDYSEGLPRTQVFDLEINRQTGELYAGTYGRGLWKAPLNAVAPPPLATFEVSESEVCRLEDISFTNTSSGDITDYLWEFGSGASVATSTLADPGVINYETSGTKTIRLTISGPGGTSSREVTVEVDENCTGNAEITCLPNICVGESITFHTPSSNSFFVFTWDFGPQASPSSGSGLSANTTFPSPGDYTVTLTRQGFGVTEVSTKTVTVTNCATQLPFKNHVFPGVIEAEDYDLGGMDVGYYDVSPGNNGGVYRQDNVDIEVSTENGFNVGWTQEQEWLEYTFDVPAANTFLLDIRVATPNSNTRMTVFLDGQPWGTTQTIPNTGGWQDWETLTLPGLFIDQGSHVLRLFMETNGFNVNYVEGRLTNGQTAYGGDPQVIPGYVEAERYDEGGEGVAYHDVDPTNNGGQFRIDGVDLEWATWGNDFNVGWIAAGEWLEYTVDIDDAGDYVMQARVASATQSGKFHVEIDGQDVSGEILAPFTGSWQQWQYVAKTVTLPQGRHVLRIYMDGQDFNLDYLYFIDASFSTPCSNVAVTGDYSYVVEDLPGQIAIDFDALGNFGDDYEIIHYAINDAGQLNYFMPQQPYIISGVNTGDLISFGFTYSTGGGTQRGTESSETYHIHRVGDCLPGGIFAGKVLHYDEFVLRDVGVTLLPNPVHDYLKVEAHEEILEVNVLEATGTEVYGALGDGVSSILVLHEMDRLPPGNYYIKVVTPSGISVKQVFLR